MAKDPRDYPKPDHGTTLKLGVDLPNGEICSGILDVFFWCPANIASSAVPDEW